MSETALTINFYGQPIITIEHDGQLYVAMRPICENIGLSWSPQRKRIMRHQMLKTCVVIMTTQMLDDDQRRDYLCLPLSMLNGWLFGVEVNRVRPEIRSTLIRYQQECFQVLFDYWRNKGRSEPAPHIVEKEIPAEPEPLISIKPQSKLIPSQRRKVTAPPDVAEAVSELLRMTSDSKLVGLALVTISPSGNYKADYHGACIDKPELTIGILHRLMGRLSKQAELNSDC